MIVRLYHADKTVRRDLEEAVIARGGMVLTTQLQGPRNLNIEDRTPFKEILEAAGSFLDVVVVVDEGRPEGMWRDPFGELCDRLYPDRREAAAATAGYVLVRGGRALAYFRKALWDPLEDAEAITAWLARAVPGVQPYVRPKSRPPPAAPKGPPKPKPKKTPIINPAPGAPGDDHKTMPEMPSVVISPDLTGDDEHTDPGLPPEAEAEAPAPPPEPPAPDPYPLLGLRRGASLDEAKKAYRALIIQYHPDKVSHLAPEFRLLAENKTRELNAAYALIEKELAR